MDWDWLVYPQVGSIAEILGQILIELDFVNPSLNSQNNANKLHIQTKDQGVPAAQAHETLKLPPKAKQIMFNQAMYYLVWSITPLHLIALTQISLTIVMK